MIVDAHLDLAMLGMEWNRDLTQSLDHINAREFGKKDLHGRTYATLNFAEMRKGGIGLCVSTLLARYVKAHNSLPGWHSPLQAWAQTQGQLAWYRAMEGIGALKQIRNLPELENHIQNWESDPLNSPIGYILSLEGADSMVALDYVEKAWEQGLRAIGPAHFGPGTYAFGTDATGGIGEKGKALIREMERLNIILDVSHLCDQSFWEAIDASSGPVWASHSNCRAIVPGERQLDDRQISELIQRKAVIGMALPIWMLVPGCEKQITDPREKGVYMRHVVDHMDHICQLAGNSHHVAIGSDLDGGFGKDQCPVDLNTIADLEKLKDLLSDRGYKQADINRIMGTNWIQFLQRVWA